MTLITCSCLINFLFCLPSPSMRSIKSMANIWRSRAPLKIIVFFWQAQLSWPCVHRLGLCGLWFIGGMGWVWFCQIPSSYWRAFFLFIANVSKFFKVCWWHGMQSFGCFGIHGMKEFFRQRSETRRRFLKRYKLFYGNDFYKKSWFIMIIL
jgi:hypothetical protein